MKLSIITPTLNSHLTIEETLASVAGQLQPGDEHLVMDGGSTDDTETIVKKYKATWHSEPDEGHVYAVNKGIARSTGSIVAVLNSDDCYEPGTLDAVRRSLHVHPDWDGCFGDTTHVDDAGKPLFRRVDGVFDYTTLLCGYQYITHHAVFLRRSVHDRLGLYDTRFQHAFDYDLFLRIGKAGLNIGSLNRCVVRYRWHRFGQSACIEVARRTWQETNAIKAEHGIRRVWLRKLLYVYGHIRHQWQKLLTRRTVDLIPARWILEPLWNSRYICRFDTNVRYLKDIK